MDTIKTVVEIFEEGEIASSENAHESVVSMMCLVIGIEIVIVTAIVNGIV